MHYRHRYILWIITIVLFGSAICCSQIVPESEIGSTPIRFYCGNLHVGMFMDYWGVPNEFTGTSGDFVDDLLIRTLKRTSCESMCDYITWSCVEQTPEEWVWQPYLESAKKLKHANLGYNVFCWLHFPPKWYLQSETFVGYANLETGESIPQLSLWSPDLERVFDRFYQKLNSNLGEYIDFVRVAMPSEYGEIGYCNVMTKWLVPQEHAKPGYWCGDAYAKEDFRKAMLEKYTTVHNLNEAWGTRFTKPEDIVMPLQKNVICAFSKSSQTRQYWVDFIDWYQQAWVECLQQLTPIIRKYFPQKELIASLGYGIELPRLGNDQSRHIEALAQLRISCQSPGDIGYFPTRRVSSACRHYGVPYYTEPPGGNVTSDRQLDRIFMDISNGTQTWFDYHPNLLRGISHFKTYKQYLTGEPPRTSVAVWHPTLEHWLHPDQNWSKHAIEISDALREIMDYEIIDDRMIGTDALDSLGINQLILAGAKWLDRDTWQQVHKWVAKGGVLIVLQKKPMEDIEGKSDLWEKQSLDNIPALNENVKTEKLFAMGTKRLGKGFVLTLDCENNSIDETAKTLGKICTHSGSYLGKPEKNAKRLDNEINGLLTTRFDKKILYFNRTKEDIEFKITYRKSDFSGNCRVPEQWDIHTNIPARSIFQVRLIER